MRKLVQNQDQANCGQHALDHGIGYIIAYDTCLQKAEQDL